jgi:hypothetical protein
VPFTITLTLSNSGGATAYPVPLPVLSLFGSGVAITATPTGSFPPGGASIAGGGTLAGTWTVVDMGGGSFSFSTTVTGQDQNSGAGFNTFVAGSAVLSVANGALQVIALTPSVSSADIGATFALSMTVSNTGTTTVFTVGPSFITPTGSGAAVQTAGPSPSAVSQLNPGETVTFNWSFRADRAGTVVFTGGAGGTDASGTISLSAPSVQSAAVTINGGGSVAEADVYPLPFHPGQGTLKFRRLPADARLRIYTAAGELVAELKADSRGSIDWDGRNKSGALIVPGVYFYVMQGPSGPKKVAKFEAAR